jgi:hypothetical protein
MRSRIIRVGACVEKPMWRTRPARRSFSADSQQPPGRSVISTQSGEFNPWNESRSMVSTPSSANDSSRCASNSAGFATGRSLVCRTNALRGWRASALPNWTSLVP